MTENYDYLKTSEAIFIQRGTFSPEGKFLGLPIYIRDEAGSRVFDGETYRKWMPNQEAAPILGVAEERKDLGGDVFQLGEEEVSKVYRHRGLRLEGQKAEVVGTLAEILESDVSMIGSCLFDAERPDSDWDVLVYGMGSYERLKERWAEVMDRLKGNDVTESQIEKKVQDYVTRFTLDQELVRKIIERRNTKFLVGEREVSV